MRRNSRLLGLRQQQQVVDQAADPRDLGLHEPLDPAHLLARGIAAGAASTSSWPRITVSGVRSSCEASATNARWPANASVSRSSMWLNASASTVTSSPCPSGSLDARVQVARVHPRGDRGHAAQRARHARRRPGRTPAARRASASSPARMNARATPRWARATPASGSPTPTVTLRPPGDAHHGA